MINLPNGRVTSTQVLLPVTLLSFVVFLLLAFQFSEVMRDRSNMRQAAMQQQPAFEGAMRTQAQLNALAQGTKVLADKGNPGAKAIIERMAKLGITVNLPAQPQAKSGVMPASAPGGAMAKKAPSSKTQAE